MKQFLFILIIWMLACIGDMPAHGIKPVLRQHKPVLNCLLLAVTVALFVCGCLVNAAYANTCKDGNQANGVVVSRDSPGIRASEWYYMYEVDLENEAIQVTACSEQYYQEGDRVTCYVAASETQMDYKSIIEGSNECQTGNRLLIVASYILLVEMLLCVCRRS